MSQGDQDFITTQELADEWDVHRSTITRWVQKGRIRPLRADTQVMLFDRSVLDNKPE